MLMVDIVSEGGLDMQNSYCIFTTVNGNNNDIELCVAIGDIYLYLIHMRTLTGPIQKHQLVLMLWMISEVFTESVSLSREFTSSLLNSFR